MSSKIRTRKNRTTVTAVTATRTLRSEPDQPITSTVRTEAEDKLWAALHANPNRTTADLSTAAKIGKSTAQKILVKWAGDGSVTRTAGIAEGGRRAADLWAIAEITDAALDDTASEQTHPDLADNADANESASGGGKADRLAPGALRGMVEDYLRDHPDTQFGATAIAQALGGKSSGAVTNICGSSDDQAASSNESDWSERDVADVLAALEADGRVVRVGCDDLGQWQVVECRRTRLPHGGLQGLVEDFLAEHPGEAFGPHAIGIALGRSSGAVANALVRLTERGAAAQVSDRPRRYGAAANE